MSYKAVVIGSSAGGLTALSSILPELPSDFPIPIFIVQHMPPNTDSFLPNYLNKLSKINVKEAQDKESIHASTVYIAPGGYHLLVEDNHSLSLDSDIRVRYSRPSVDVLFESAADVFRQSLIGIILTGANDDGAAGLHVIKSYGGLTIVQDPKTAEAPRMPSEAIKTTKVDHIMATEKIAPYSAKSLNHLFEKKDILMKYHKGIQKIIERKTPSENMLKDKQKTEKFLLENNCLIVQGLMYSKYLGIDNLEIFLKNIILN